MSSKKTYKLCFSLEDDEKLVEAISSRPAIYDPKQPLYKDQRVKDNTWDMISEEVGRSVADCKKRWRNIRDTYDRKIRENKTGSDAPSWKKAKRWQLEEQLSFLQTVDVKRKSFCNIKEGNESSAHDGSVGCNIPEIEQETPAAAAVVVLPQPRPPKQIVSPKEMLAKKRTDQPKKMGFRDNISFSIEKRSKERDKIMMKMMKSLLDKIEETDDISLFFQSIAKSVQKMPPNLQRRAKLETLTLISNIESEMWTSRQETSGSNQKFMLCSPSTSARSDVSLSPDAQT